MAVLFESEEFREEFTALCEKLAAGPTAVKSLVIAGASGGEGATTVALNLALAFAEHRSAQTLLVDANLRHPNLHQVLDIACEKGLSDWDEASEPTYKPSGLSPNLWVLTAGTQPERNSWERWGTILPALQQRTGERFGMVIFDSPAVGRYPESLALARHAGGVVLVAESDHTSLEMLQYAREQIGSVGAEVVGLILNRRGRYIPRWLRR